MSLRALLIVMVLGCGSSRVDPDEPQTAREKQLREAKASGDIDPQGKSWGHWRYGGDRKDCFYVIAGGKCFKTENAACQASHCKAPKKCATAGVGPATVSCSK
jgi:hypothetical protein